TVSAHGAVGAIGSRNYPALGESRPSVYFQAVRRGGIEVPAGAGFCSQRIAAESSPARDRNQARLSAEPAARFPATERRVTPSRAIAAKDRRTDWSRHGHDGEDLEAGELGILLLALHHLQRFARLSTSRSGHAADP